MGEEIKPFFLVEFIKKGKTSGKYAAQISIDIVHSNWVLTDMKNNHSSKLMAPPYAADDVETLQDFVKLRTDPPESWPLYPIKIKGYAGLL